MSTRVISAFENERYPLADLLSYKPSTGEVRLWHQEVRSKAQHIKHDLGLRHLPLSLDEHDGELIFRASGIAGTLRLFNTHLQLVPKFVRVESSAGTWHRSLLVMMDRVRRKHYTYSRVQGINLQRVTFIDHIALAYADALEIALRQEPIHIYQTREETAPYLRGRLAIGRQMQSVLDRPHRIHCDVDYLETDNPFNHMLHWAARRFISIIFESQVRRQLIETLRKLPSISGPPRLPLHLPTAIPPQYSHYSEALSIASMLAKGYGHGQEMGRFSGYGYVLNMEKLFESFIDKSLSQVIAMFDAGRYTMRTQDTRRYAEPFGHTGKSYFTRPDNVLYEGGNAVLLIDAKYKRLADAEDGTTLRPQNSDIYQLFASLISHRCDRGLLIYPRLVADKELGDGNIRFWKVPGTETSRLIGAVAIDISCLTSRNELEQFDKIFIECIQQVLALSV